MQTQIVSAGELAYLRTQPLDISWLLTLVFSAKECFFKAAYRAVQAYFDFDAVQVVGLDLQRGRLRLRCVRQLCPGLEQDSGHEAYFELLDERTVFTAMVLAADGRHPGLATTTSR